MEALARGSIGKVWQGWPFIFVLGVLVAQMSCLVSGGQDRPQAGQDSRIEPLPPQVRLQHPGNPAAPQPHRPPYNIRKFAGPVPVPASQAGGPPGGGAQRVRNRLSTPISSTRRIGKASNGLSTETALKYGGFGLLAAAALAIPALFLGVGSGSGSGSASPPALNSKKSDDAESLAAGGPADSPPQSLADVVDSWGVASRCSKAAICDAHANYRDYGLIALPLLLFFPGRQNLDGSPSSDWQEAAMRGKKRQACHERYDCMVNPLWIVKFFTTILL